MVDPTKAENIFEFPGQPKLGCGTLESVGIAGTIPLSQCSSLSTVLSDTSYGDCGCMACNNNSGDSSSSSDDNNESNPTPAPVPNNPTRSPSLPPNTPPPN